MKRPQVEITPKAARRISTALSRLAGLIGEDDPQAARIARNDAAVLLIKNDGVVDRRALLKARRQSR